MEYIKVNNQKDILKIGLQDMDGQPILDKKGETVFWQFDLSDIELPLKLSKIEYQHHQNQKWARNQFLIIDKKEDIKGKFLLSKNEEDKINVLKEYYKKEEEILDIILGVGGTKKFLNGRNYYWEMFEDINDVLEQIIPKFESTFTNITDRIKKKYDKKEDNIIE